MCPSAALPTRRPFLVVLFALLYCSNVAHSQDTDPYGSLFSERNIAELTRMATRLAASAAEHSLAAQKDILTRPGHPETAPVTLDQRPSEMIGQSFTNALSPAISQLVGPQAQPQPSTVPRALAAENERTLRDSAAARDSSPLASLAEVFFGGMKRPESPSSPPPSPRPSMPAFSFPSLSAPFAPRSSARGLPSVSFPPPFPLPPSPPPTPPPKLLAETLAVPSALLEPTMKPGQNKALLQLAEAFFGVQPRFGTGRTASSAAAFGTKQASFEGPNGADPIPTIRQLAPGANDNFFMPRGEGCLPFLSEFMQIAYGNCVKEADEKTWDVWGGEITHALTGEHIDFLKAAKETCKRGAERQQCGQLRKAISECDILGSLQVAMQMQRAIKRCDEMSGIMDQNPVHVLSQVNSIIGGEVAQGFLHKFLGQ